MPVQTVDLRSALAHLHLPWPVGEGELRAAYRRLAMLHHPDRGGRHADFVRTQHSFEAVLAAIRDGGPAGAWRDEADEADEADRTDGADEADETDAADEADRAYRGFARGFGRSRRGNLWRVWRGRNVTVHTGRRGGFSYCVSADDEGPRFARRWFDTEDEAMHALWRAVREGGW
jgi:hypothetical protein